MNGRTNGDDLNTDSLFRNIRPQVVEPSKKWRMFDPKCNHFFTNRDQLCEIRDKKKYVCWDPEGNPKGKAIGDEEPEPKDSKPDGDTKPSSLDLDDGQYLVIRDKKIRNVLFSATKLEFSAKIKIDIGYSSDPIAIIKTSDGNTYIIRDDGKYCKTLSPKKKEVIKKLTFI